MVMVNILYLFSALRSTLLGLIAPIRPLKPPQRERKKVAKNINILCANIVIRVVRAFNVPLRSNWFESIPGQLENIDLSLSVTNEDVFTQAVTGNSTAISSDTLHGTRKNCQVLFYMKYLVHDFF